MRKKLSTLTTLLGKGPTDWCNPAQFSAGSQVAGNPKAIESFKTFKSQYEQEFDSPIADTFEISENAVKKQSRVYKSVLKLDKNFHIYIHGNKELIEKGFDEGKHMNYYKVYFKEEQ